MFILLFSFVCSLLNIGCAPLIGATEADKKKSYTELKNQYDFHCQNPSDISEHLPVLKELVLDCRSVVEIGVRSMVSTWAILHGLSENRKNRPIYLGIDLELPPVKTLRKAKTLAKAAGISFNFWQANDMSIRTMRADLLFIDSLHTYCHLTYELEKFSPKINKYIVLHDTSEPWGNRDDADYHGDYSEYPKHIDRNKKGLWPAVEDFLNTHPEWSLYQRYFNLHGFTILQRNS